MLGIVHGYCLKLSSSLLMPCQCIMPEVLTADNKRSFRICLILVHHWLPPTHWNMDLSTYPAHNFHFNKTSSKLTFPRSQTTHLYLCLIIHHVRLFLSIFASSPLVVDWSLKTCTFVMMTVMFYRVCVCLNEKQTKWWLNNSDVIKWGKKKRTHVTQKKPQTPGTSDIKKSSPSN